MVTFGEEDGMWDANQYLRYGDERGRPFLDLIARVGATDPRYVVDLGCGPGNLTALLAERWPSAEVTGVDSSAEMIEAARADGPGGISFEVGDVRDWRPARPADVITCNAVLQWVPGHHDLVAGWADMLAPGGWLAFQLPGNFDSPNHTVIGELAASPRWRALLADVRLNRQAGAPEQYAALLARPGFRVDAWETTYVHILAGDNPVVEWAKGTALRPVLAALDSEQAAAFLAEYADRLRGAYKHGPFGTFFPFRRVFTVVHRTSQGGLRPLRARRGRHGEPGGLVTVPAGAKTIDEMLASARERLDRVTPREALAEQADGAVLVDIRPAWQRAAHGEIPGSWIIERNHLEWRLDPASGARLPWVTGYDHRIIVFCEEGYTSSLAAASLRDLGLARATDMIGGQREWAAGGLPAAPASARAANVAPGAVHAG